MVFFFLTENIPFYQNWPFGAAHGLKEWVHNESDDLVHFHVTEQNFFQTQNEIASVVQFCI